MDEPYCRKCNDTQWVCENHPDQEGHRCTECNGAAMPCTCHPLHGHEHAICVCGDYRYQHKGNTGACELNGLGHGGAPACHEFTLASNDKI